MTNALRLEGRFSRLKDFRAVFFSFSFSYGGIFVSVLTFLTAKYRLGRSLFLLKNGFWPSYCQISTDLDIVLQTPIVVGLRNTLVGRLTPRSASGMLQVKPEQLCFVCVILVTHTKSYIETTDRRDFDARPSEWR